VRGFEGRVAVVTGAGSGIGQAVAARVVAEGGRVLGVDIDADRLSATQALIGDGITTLDADLAAPEASAAVWRASSVPITPWM